MTSTNKRDGGEVELLPLPDATTLWRSSENTHFRVDGHTDEAMQAYARANVERALAESRAEVEALRASIGGDAGNHVAIERDHHKARAERLAGLLREALPFVNDVAHDDETWQRIDAALSLEPTP